MRIAVVTPVFWPEVRRGAERFAAELTAGLTAEGEEALIVTAHRGLPSDDVEDGLRVVRVPRLPEGRLRRRLFEDHLTHMPFATRALRRIAPDVAHALYPTSAVAALRADVPLVFGYMGIPHRQGLANRRRRLELTLEAVRGAAAVTALSRHAAEGFRRWLAVEAQVIHPPVDTETFTPDPAARAAVPTIVCAADLAEPRKRVALLVEAFALVRRDRPDARLILSRPRRDAALPAGEGIEIRDLDSRAALVAAYREAWVSALPSVGEAFGLVLAEAMACGTPGVAADREALPEVIDRPGTGVLFDGDDAPALARALLEGLDLATDPGTAAACRARAEELSVPRCVEAHRTIYAAARAARS